MAIHSITCPEAPPGSAAALLGANIRALRAWRDWTLAQLAQESGVHLTVVSRIEHGKAWPSAESLDALSRALGVPVAALFEDRDR